MVDIREALADAFIAQFEHYNEVNKAEITIKTYRQMSKSLVSISDFDKEEILKIMELAAHFESNPGEQLLHGRVFATLFSNRPHGRVSVSRVR